MVTKWSPHTRIVTTEGQDLDTSMPSDLHLRRIETDGTTLSRLRPPQSRGDPALFWAEWGLLTVGEALDRNRLDGRVSAPTTRLCPAHNGLIAAPGSSTKASLSIQS